MQRKNIVVYFVILFFVSVGPIFNNIPIKLTFFLLIFFAYVTIAQPIKTSKKHVFNYMLLILFLFTTAVSCVVNHTIMPFVFSGLFAISAFSMLQVSHSQIVRIIEILTNIFKYAIVLAWIGYIYSLFGGPMFFLSNPNGAANGFYLSTFSITPSPVRPSSFYDEPGAFSFFICLLVFFRTYLGMNLRMSVYLIVGGLVTQSIAHAVFGVVWILSIILTNESNTKFTFFQRVATMVGFFLMVLSIYLSGVLQWAIDRTTSWSENPDSVVRIINYNNVLNEVWGNTDKLYYGFNHDCISRVDCEGLSENVLTPIAMGGLMASWPFYLFIIFCCIYPFLTFKNFSLLGIGLLLLQRPYFLELPYSLCLTLIITLLISVKSKQLSLTTPNYVDGSIKLYEKN